MTRLQFVVNTRLPASTLLSRPEVFSKPITGITGLVQEGFKEQGMQEWNGKGKIITSLIAYKLGALAF